MHVLVYTIYCSIANVLLIDWLWNLTLLYHWDVHLFLQYWLLHLVVLNSSFPEALSATMRLVFTLRKILGQYSISYFVWGSSFSNEKIPFFIEVTRFLVLVCPIEQWEEDKPCHIVTWKQSKALSFALMIDNNLQLFSQGTDSRKIRIYFFCFHVHNF